MGTLIDQSKVGVKHRLQARDRVGTRPATEAIETFLRRAYDLFGDSRVKKDVVQLLEMFYFYKIGRDGNIPSSGKQAVIAICAFLAHCKTPPWHWTPQHLYAFLTELHNQERAISTIRRYHHYIKHFCDAILSDRDLANKLMARHPDANFQQITDIRSRSLVKGYGKKKKKLSNPTPLEVQRVMDYLESEIIEAIETGQPRPYILLRDRTIIATFYAYGLRLSELRNTNVTDFDFDPEHPRYGDLGILHVIGKGNKERHLPILATWIHPVLEAYLEHVRPYWTHDPRTPEKDKHALFFSNNRKRLSKTSLQRIIKDRFHQAGVKKDISPHRLRNGFLTRMADDVGLSEASRAAGHAHAHTTEGYYDRKASLAGDALSNYVNKLYKQQTDDP
jgi:site-specific recombinase XerD